MKKRSAIVVGGLSGGVLLAGWLQHLKLQQLSEEYRAEKVRADALGVVEGREAPPSGPALREGREANAEPLLQRLAAMPGEREIWSDTELMKLGGAELEALAARLISGKDIDPAFRLRMVRTLIRMHAGRYPEIVLKLYTASPEFYAGQAEAPYLVAAALKHWASIRPLDAAAWARAMAERVPDLIVDDARLEILAGAARSDAQLAVTLAKELGLDREPSTWSRMGEAAKTPEERLTVLAVLRQYQKENPDDPARAQAASSGLAGLSRGVLASGYEDARKWLEAARLSELETQVFASELHPWFSKAESGLWLDWLGENLKGESLGDKTAEIMAEWTRKDYSSAGAWLNARPEGPLREAAIAGYAGAIAGYEPATAAEWALLLPESEARTALLMKVHEEWAKKDPPAAEGFARKAGLAGP